MVVTVKLILMNAIFQSTNIHIHKDTQLFLISTKCRLGNVLRHRILNRADANVCCQYTKHRTAHKMVSHHFRIIDSMNM